MKMDHLRTIDLCFGCVIGKRKQKGRNSRPSKGENSAAPVQAFQVILKSISSVHHVHEGP